jgi:hypothetical protein
MPTKRTWRDRQQQAFPSAYCLSELLTGKIMYPVIRYDGYGDGVGIDLRDFISHRMRDDWAYHREELLAWWISGEWSSKLPNRKPWLWYGGAPGTRPWAWWHLESHPPRASGEGEAAYLTRHDLWLPRERQGFAKAGLAVGTDGAAVALRPSDRLK